MIVKPTKKFVLSESNTHAWLKNYAAKLLRENYSCDRIEFEYRMLTMDGRKVTIDVVGFKDTEKYAVECGHTEDLKLYKLRPLFKEVIALDYETAITYLLNEIEELKKQLEAKPRVIGKKQVKFVRLDLLHNRIELVDAKSKTIVCFKIDFLKGEKNADDTT